MTAKAKRNGHVSGITPKCTVRMYVGREMDTLRTYVGRRTRDHSEPRHLSRAVGRLDEFLGRPALLRDLNNSTLRLFFDWMRDEIGLAEATRFTYQERILQIGRHAAERSIIKWPSPTWQSRLPSTRPPDDSGLLGLVRYFDEVFLANRQSNGSPLSASTVKSYRSAIRAYERFVGPQNASCHCITQKKVQQFRRWLLDNRMQKKKAGNHAFAVATVAKHARPERFIDPQAEQRASDSERALAYVFEHEYLPAKPTITSQASDKKYRAVFDSFSRHLGHVATLDDLTDRNVGAYMREIRRLGRSTKTVNGYRSKLVAFWNWCARKRLVEEFPTIAAMPEPATMPQAWSSDELRALVRGCDRMPGAVAGIPSPLWWRALHLVVWDCGERTGALLALRWDMLDAKTRQLVVPAEFRKGGRKPMLYVLKPDTVRLLQQIRQPDQELMLPFDRDRSAFFMRYRRLLKLAGLPYVPWKSGLQKMRRSFATHIEAAGGNATDALQHSERSITEESYLDPRYIDREPANKLLFEITR